MELTADSSNTDRPVRAMNADMSLDPLFARSGSSSERALDTDGRVRDVHLDDWLGALIAWATRSHWQTVSTADQVTFDPVSTSLIGIVFSQFAIGVIGSLLITSEYASGLIRTTLGAVRSDSCWCRENWSC